MAATLPGGPRAGSPSAATRRETTSLSQVPVEPTENGGKGLDAGLTKACPPTDLLTKGTYKRFKKQLDLFERLCRRRSAKVEQEGAFLLLSMI